MALQTQPNSLPADIIFDDLDSLKSYTKMGRTAIYNAIRQHGFPEPYQLGARVARWKRTEILAWLENRPRGTRLTPMMEKARQKAA
ncbi:helix-turn-helix transcriptional regulator [Eoetvoesiella caeni]